MKALLVFLGGLACGVVLTLVLAPSPAVPPLPPAPPAAPAEAEVESLRREIAAQNNTIHQLHAAAAAASRLAEPPPAPPPNPMAGLAKLMDNPAMKKMMAASQQKVIKDNYADAEAATREFLNSDADFARYEAHTASLPQRMALRTMQPGGDPAASPAK